MTSASATVWTKPHGRDSHHERLHSIQNVTTLSEIKEAIFYTSHSSGKRPVEIASFYLRNDSLHVLCTFFAEN